MDKFMALMVVMVSWVYIDPLTPELTKLYTLNMHCFFPANQTLIKWFKTKKKVGMGLFM